MPYPISWEFAWPYLLAALLGGYLIGSIPYGLVLVRLSGLGDVRRIGSGNIGATNVLRTGRKDLALLTLVLDAGKGAFAAWLGWRFGRDAMVVAAAGAMLGHCFPLWLGFRGGKGVATALGILIYVMPAIGIAACLTWLIVAALFRYSSLASLAALWLAPAYAYLVSYTALGAYGGLAQDWADPQRAELAVLIAILSTLRHRGNIGRLLAGTESKIGRPK